MRAGISFLGKSMVFFLKKTMRSMNGVATKNRRNPNMIGSISSVMLFTTTNEPAHAKLTRIRRSEMRN